MHWTSSSIALSATLLFLAPAAQAQTPLAPGELARVADRAILKSEYDHWVPIAQAAGSKPDPTDDSDVREQVMQFLISFQWIDLEAERLRISVSTGAVYTSYRRQKEESFPREKDFQRFLKTSHQTVADIKRRVRLDLLSNKLRDRAIRGAKTPRGQERRLTRYVSEFTQRWIDQTVCADGYDTDDCGSVVPLST